MYLVKKYASQYCSQGGVRCVSTDCVDTSLVFIGSMMLLIFVHKKPLKKQRKVERI